MVLDFAKEALANAETHSINFDELRAGKANIKVFGVGGAGSNAITWLFNKGKRGASGADMVFINVGLGGGTGTGAAPVIAQLAKESGAVVIAIATMPFDCEKARHEKAEFGLQELTEVVDTAILIDNNRLVDIAGNLPMEQAFAVSNELVSTMIKGIVETITLPSLINLDYADVSAIMKNGEVAVIGVGESDTTAR